MGGGCRTYFNIPGDFFQSYCREETVHPEQSFGPGEGAEWIMARGNLPNIRGISVKLGNKWGIDTANGGKKGPQGMRTLDETQKKLYYL